MTDGGIPYVYILAKGYHIMRTNIVIDDDLMNKALAATGAKTKRAVVELALRRLIQMKRQEEILAYRGKLKWEGDLDAMRTD